MTGTTIGIAIAVPEPYGTMLRRARRSFGDVQADVIPTHITLLPPGPIEDGGLPLVLEHLARVAAGTAPFDVVLRGTDTFRPVSPVVFVCVAEGAQDRDGNPITADQVRAVIEERLHEDTRVTILGHVQRGGRPSAYDRWASTWLGYAAAQEVLVDPEVGLHVRALR